MTSTIETELLRITKLKPARVESRAQLLTRLWDAAHSLSERDWDKLSAPAATWVNDITHQNKLWKAKKPNGEFIPDEFPDLVQASEEPVDEEPVAESKPKTKAGPKPKPEPEEAPEEEDEEEPTDELPESKPEEDGDEEVLQTRGAKPKPQEVEETEEDEPEEEVAASEPEDEELAEKLTEEALDEEELDEENKPEPVQTRAKPAPKPVPAKLMERAPKIAPKPAPKEPAPKEPAPKEPAPKAAPKKAPQPEYERPATNVQGMVRLKIIENPGIETAALQQEIEDAFGTKVSTETVRSSRSWFKAALRDLNHAGCLSKKFQAELIAAGALRKGS